MGARQLRVSPLVLTILSAARFDSTAKGCGVVKPRNADRHNLVDLFVMLLVRDESCLRLATIFHLILKLGCRRRSLASNAIGTEWSILVLIFLLDHRNSQIDLADLIIELVHAVHGAHTSHI